jgi:hypothetical protein
MGITTKTDAGGGNEWRIDDEILHLREWAADTTHALPTTGEGTIGALDGNWIRLDDPTGRVSKQHATLRRMQEKWLISDLGSKNGIRQDGARRLSFPLSPGTEISIGGVTLIAESPRFVALRDFVCRLIGWSEGARKDVDLALRAIRTAASRRDSLLLCGDGDLVTIAQQLHRHALGDDKPFVVCDPRRRRADSNARAAANYDTGLVALEAAVGGTLCVWHDRQPDDFAAVVSAIREPSSRVQLVVCTHALERGEPLISTPVVLPSLRERETEVDRIIDAYGAEAAAALGGRFTDSDRVWIRREEATTLADVERAARRLVAIRSSGGSITRAAKILSMSHSALSEWVARRTLPP